jgi:hypothetical protein
MKRKKRLSLGTDAMLLRSIFAQGEINGRKKTIQYHRPKESAGLLQELSRVKSDNGGLE